MSTVVGDARWGPAFFAFIFTVALVLTEAAVFILRR
jgi:hypothetical protein